MKNNYEIDGVNQIDTARDVTNKYGAPEVIEIGNASDLVLGTNKFFPLLPDSSGQPFRSGEISEEE